jgi:hypothetical protein
MIVKEGYTSMSLGGRWLQCYYSTKLKSVNITTELGQSAHPGFEKQASRKPDKFSIVAENI